MLETLIFIASAGLFGVLIIIAFNEWALRAHSSHLKAYRRFEQWQQEFNDLQRQFIDESWYWPIRVRPVLYVEIDRWAQILFAHAQKEIATAEEIELEISPIPHPKSEPEREFRLPIYVNIISQHYRILLLISKYESHIKNARSIIGELQAGHLKITQLQAKVKAKIHEIDMELENIAESLNTRKRVYPGVYQELQWAYFGAQNCLFEANNQIKTAEESVNDGLEYAIADTLHYTTEYFLEHIKIALNTSFGTN